MKPIAVDVTLTDGITYTFSQGRSWQVDEFTDDAGRLTILDEDGSIIALIAPSKWAIVGYRYVPHPEQAKQPQPVPDHPDQISWK